MRKMWKICCEYGKNLCKFGVNVEKCYECGKNLCKFAMNVWKMKCKCEENVVCLENVVKIKCWKMCCECGKNLGKFGVNV